MDDVHEVKLYIYYLTKWTKYFIYFLTICNYRIQFIMDLLLLLSLRNQRSMKS
jgi:hypothetical protein